MTLSAKDPSTPDFMLDGIDVRDTRSTLSKVLQPGLIGIVKWYAVLQMLKGLLWMALASRLDQQLRFINLVPLITSIGFLIYIYSGVLRAQLGRWYLIFTITIATLDALITKSEFWYWLSAHSLSTVPIVDEKMLPAFIRWLAMGVVGDKVTAQPFAGISILISLLLLLVAVSWQYDHRFVIGYTLLSSLFDLWLNTLLVSSTPLQVFIGVFILIGRTVIFLVVGNLVAHLVGIQNKQHQSLISANEKLARYASMVEELAISHERNRMARELHDTLAHTLSAASVQLEATHALWQTDATKARLSLERGLDTIRNGLTETRRALQALRASPLDDLGFALALKELGEITQQRCGANVSVALPLRLQPLASELEHALFRVAQEAFENIVRYAHAKHVRLSLTQTQDQVQMLIEDDGVGFDVAQTRADPDRFGLRGMTERIEALGGQLHIESMPKHGTRILLEAKFP